MGSFLVNSYEVQAGATSASPPAGPEILHALLLRGTPDEGSSVTIANIWFFPTRPSNYPGTVSGNTVVGHLTDNLFASWYDILRSEKPVRLFYDPHTGPLLNLLIFTGTEPLGEGPVDR
jgi:hypothetical protein